MREKINLVNTELILLKKPFLGLCNKSLSSFSAEEVSELFELEAMHSVALISGCASLKSASFETKIKSKIDMLIKITILLFPVNPSVFQDEFSTV